MQASRYKEAWADAVRSVAEARRRGAAERRYRRMLALTDGLLGRLEVRNLKGGGLLDERLRRDIVRTLYQIEPDARARFPLAQTVQEAIDGTFEVQSGLLQRLQRLVQWDRGDVLAWDRELERKTA